MKQILKFKKKNTFKEHSSKHILTEISFKKKIIFLEGAKNQNHRTFVTESMSFDWKNASIHLTIV